MIRGYTIALHISGAVPHNGVEARPALR